MRKGLLVLLAVATVCILMVPATASSEADTGSLEFYGYISHGGMPMESPNVMNIEIYHKVQDEKIIDGTFSDKLDKNDGHFSITVPDFNKNITYYISIRETGYVVYNIQDSLTEVTKGFEYRINYDVNRIKDGKFYISEYDKSIGMCSAHGSITGKVVSSSGGNPYLNGVKITITSYGSDKTQSVFTHNNGEFTFDNVEVGTYKLVAENKGFITLEKEDVVVNPSITEDVGTIQMNPTEGIVSSHWMTIGGLIAALILMILVIIHIVRVKKKSKSSLE